MYHLVCSLYPRMTFTLNDKLEHLPVGVRVGQAVDTVGQAGNPRRITGFQTHTSPVLISNTDRCELATDEWLPVGNAVLENFVILEKNPEFEAEQEREKRIKEAKANNRKKSGVYL